ncbi:hypothetical protein A4X06_0g9834 [Tilletia controversa]|uniref:Uncharacterized protein n=1 Tax=Tilletia controversa TaxID=13291 RepID=A0A8X7MHQ4_9BASI|nr:hypothetical protein A4X06_0g9834 [Tilletia controversa]
MQARFKILTTGCYYDVRVQADLFQALAVVHNFIRRHDPHNDVDNVQGIGGVNDEEADEVISATQTAEAKEATKVRNRIAKLFSSKNLAQKSAAQLFALIDGRMAGKRLVYGGQTRLVGQRNSKRGELIDVKRITIELKELLERVSKSFVAVRHAFQRQRNIAHCVHRRRALAFA